MTTGKETSRIAQFISDRIYELRGVRSQREIAEIAGYTSQNMITMIKQGYSKVALDRVIDLAKALDTDPIPLMRMAMEQFYSPRVIKDIDMTLGAILTRNEARLLDIYRDATGGSDPSIDQDKEAKIRAIFQ